MSARRTRRRVAAVTAAVAALLGGVVLTGAGSAAAAVPTGDAATVRLAGPLTPAAPDADRVETVTIPLTVTNTSSGTLYDLRVSSLRSAPITTGAGLDTAFGGAPVEESDATKPGPSQDLPEPLAPGATTRVDYRVDTSSERTGICLCFLGAYALDVTVTAADEQSGETATVGRVQTYLPSLLDVPEAARVGVGWLWPLVDRPHRLGTGSVFTDDDLAASVGSGGRLDRALQVVQSVDAARPAAARSLLLLLDPDLLDELVTMTGGYTVQAADGSTSVGTGGTAAREWLARLASVLPRHDVRVTPPADPDVVGMSARAVPVQTSPDAATTARIAAALRLPGGTLPPGDLAWPARSTLGAGGIAALAAAGATRVVLPADTDDDGAVAAVAERSGAGTRTPVLLADPGLTAQADSAIGLGQDNSAALQRLVVTAAMTGVEHADDSRFVFVVPDRDQDVAPAAAVRAILATTSLGRPVSPLTALATAATGTTRTDLLGPDPGPPPAPLGQALDAASAATVAAATIRAAVVSGADGVVGDLADHAQRVASNSWVGDSAGAARTITALTDRATALTGAVRVVVRTTGSYSLASADAPLLLTVSNDLPVAVEIRVDVTAVGRSNGFEAEAATVQVAAGSRPTLRVPTRVARSGRFDVAVTLRTDDGRAIGPSTEITVTSTAVGKVGQIVTYGAGALLLLALLVRGVRRVVTRSRAGSDRTGPDDDSPRPDGRPEGQPTVPATPS